MQYIILINSKNLKWKNKIFKFWGQILSRSVPIFLFSFLYSEFFFLIFSIWWSCRDYAKILFKKTLGQWLLNKFLINFYFGIYVWGTHNRTQLINKSSYWNWRKLYSLTKIAKKIFISYNDFLFVLRIMSCATICINMNEINLKLPCLFWLMYQWHFN